ncbi:MAG: sortase [Anaerolineae bacterium]|nr:sortase [Anaerolineae bacterium]
MSDSRVCPFLVRANPSSAIQPDEDNRCALIGETIPLRRDIQARYCLGGRYALCSAYAAHAEQGGTARWHGPSWRLSLLAVSAVVAVLAVAIWFVWSGRETARGESPAIGEATPLSVTVQASRITVVPATTPEAVPTITRAVATIAPTPTPTPRPTATARALFVPAPVVFALASQATASPTPSRVEVMSAEEFLSAPPTVPLPPTSSRVVPSATPTAGREGEVAVQATAEISFIALPTPTPEGAASPREHETTTPSPADLWTPSPPERIVAPSIGLDAPVVPVDQKVVRGAGGETIVWQVADYAAGWHRGSAMPGQRGNIVISGHHNINGKVFRYLVDLQEGDEVDLYARGRRFRYVVQRKMILKEKGESLEVRRRNARWIGPFPDERLTLVTCWPYESNTYRVIVVARPMTLTLPSERPTPPVNEP